jgi:hypothetical protein
MCAHQIRGGDSELRTLQRALEKSMVCAARRWRSRTRRARDEMGEARRYAAHAPAQLLRSHQSRGGSSLPAAAPEFLNPELSLLSFQERVLAVAEDPSTPLRERLRFVSIVAANIDEFFMVRMAGLLAMAGEVSEEQPEGGLSVFEQVAAIRDSVRELSARQTACVRECFQELEHRNVRICRWSELTAAQQEVLETRFRDDVQPLLTPFAMTLAPGHPLPRLAHLSLAIAAIVRNRAGGPPRFAELELPRSVPRFFECRRTIPLSSSRSRKSSTRTSARYTRRDARTSVRLPRDAQRRARARRTRHR